MFFRGFNWVFDRATNGYVGGRPAARPPRGADDPARRGGGRRRRPLRPRAPGRVHPRRGPGAPRRQRAAPARRVPRADGRRADPGRADRREDRGRRRLLRRSAATGSSRTPTSRTSGPSSSASSPGRSATAPPCTSRAIMASLAARSSRRSRRRSSSRSTSRPSPASAPRRASTSCSRTGAARSRVEELGAETRQVPDRGAPAARARQPLHLVRPELSPGEGRARPGEGAHARRAHQRRVPGDVGGAGRQPT